MYTVHTDYTLCTAVYIDNVFNSGAGHVLMDDDVEVDAKYKAYATQVEKVLREFERPREWADLCSCLTKLKRVRFVT